MYICIHDIHTQSYVYTHSASVVHPVFGAIGGATCDVSTVDAEAVLALNTRCGEIKRYHSVVDAMRSRAPPPHPPPSPPSPPPPLLSFSFLSPPSRSCFRPNSALDRAPLLAPARELARLPSCVARQGEWLGPTQYVDVSVCVCMYIYIYV